MIEDLTMSLKRVEAELKDVKVLMERAKMEAKIFKGLAKEMAETLKIPFDEVDIITKHLGYEYARLLRPNDGRSVLHPDTLKGNNEPVSTQSIADGVADNA